MKGHLSSFAVGLIFAIGLGISGMTLPERVVGFLDVFGNWNPSLMFVMLGALIVHGLLYRLIRKRSSPLFASEWYIPSRKDITPSVVVGASLFGFGWGLAGYCPAPAITALASFSIKPFVFVLAMIAGMLLFRFWQKVSPWQT